MPQATGVVLWTCRAIEGGIPGTMGHYLQFPSSTCADVNSTSLRGALIQSHSLDEVRLNQLSTEALIELLGPVLRVNG